MIQDQGQILQILNLKNQVYTEHMSTKQDLLEGISDVIRDVMESENGSYPEEAVPIGTYVRSSKWDMLGVITDGFNSESNGQRVIVYTVLFLPNTQVGSYYKNIMNQQREKIGMRKDNSLQKKR